MGYKYKGVKSGISYLNFCGGIKVHTLGLRTNSEKEKNNNRWVKEIGIAIWGESEGVSQKDFLGKSNRGNIEERVRGLTTKGNDWKLTL